MAKYGLTPSEANVANSLVYIIPAATSPFIGYLVDKSGYNLIWCQQLYKSSNHSGITIVHYYYRFDRVNSVLHDERSISTYVCIPQSFESLKYQCALIDTND